MQVQLGELGYHDLPHLLRYARLLLDPGAAAPAPPPRTTIINLKGSQDLADWLEAVHRRTHLSKAVIMRLALARWAEHNGHPPFPTPEDDR